MVRQETGPETAQILSSSSAGDFAPVKSMQLPGEAIYLSTQVVMYDRGILPGGIGSVEEDPIPAPPEEVPEPPEPEPGTDVDRELLRRRIYVSVFVAVTLTVLFAPLWEVDVERYDVVEVRATNNTASTLCEVEIRDEGVGGEYSVTFFVGNQTETASTYIDTDQVGFLAANVSGWGSFFCHCEVDAPKGKERISMARALYNGLMGV